MSLSRCPRNLPASTPPGGEEGPLGVLKFWTAGPHRPATGAAEPGGQLRGCRRSLHPGLPFPICLRSQALRTKRPRDFLLFLSWFRHPLVLTGWSPGPRPRAVGKGLGWAPRSAGLGGRRCWRPPGPPRDTSTISAGSSRCRATVRSPNVPGLSIA